MNNAGDFNLTTQDGSEVALAITTASTQICDVVDDLDGMTALTLFLRFVYGSGGTACKVYLQTSVDEGSTWVDICCIAFGTASATRLVNLSGLTPKTTPVTPTDGTLTDDTCVDGILGDRLRLKVVSTGTYAGSTQLQGKVACR